MESVRIIEDLRYQIDQSHSTLVSKARTLLSDDEIKMLEIRTAMLDTTDPTSNTRAVQAAKPAQFSIKRKLSIAIDIPT